MPEHDLVAEKVATDPSPSHDTQSAANHEAGRNGAAKPELHLTESSPTEPVPATGSGETATSTSQEKVSEKDDGLDETNPVDFEGQVTTDSSLPSLEVLRKIESYTVLDRHGKSRPFKNLYSGRSAARRVLIIFVRHFFCGNCQEYLQTLSKSITPEALLKLPISTSIAIVGCGDPGLIDMYAHETGCMFPIFTDPTRQLFQDLGMIRTLNLGLRPAYQRRSMAKVVFSSIVQGLKYVPSGLITKAGDTKQIGGEFLFEPLEFTTPISSPLGGAEDEQKRLELPVAQGASQNSSDSSNNNNKSGAGASASRSHRSASAASQLDPDGHGEETGPAEEKRVTWCSRMKTTRDHVEIPELMEVLGLDGEGEPIADRKRWSKALLERKGTGLSMASQMSQMKIRSSSSRKSRSSEFIPEDQPV